MLKNLVNAAKAHLNKSRRLTEFRNAAVKAVQDGVLTVSEMTLWSAWRLTSSFRKAMSAAFAARYCPRCSPLCNAINVYPTPNSKALTASTRISVCWSEKSRVARRKTSTGCVCCLRLTLETSQNSMWRTAL